MQQVKGIPVFSLIFLSLPGENRGSFLQIAGKQKTAKAFHLSSIYETVAAVFPDFFGNCPG